MGLFLFASRTVKMALTYRRKIHKEGNASPDELEQNVAQALYDLEQGDLKQDLKYLHIVAVKDVTVAAGKSALVVVIPFRLAANFRKIHTRLIHELEKKFGKNVVIICQRRILQDLEETTVLVVKRDQTVELLHLFIMLFLMILFIQLILLVNVLDTRLMVLNNLKYTWIRKTNQT